MEAGICPELAGPGLGAGADADADAATDDSSPLRCDLSLLRATAETVLPQSAARASRPCVDDILLFGFALHVLIVYTGRTQNSCDRGILLW